jgi:hypothetical protein
MLRESAFEIGTSIAGHTGSDRASPAPALRHCGNSLHTRWPPAAANLIFSTNWDLEGSLL